MTNTEESYSSQHNIESTDKGTYSENLPISIEKRIIYIT